MAAGPGLRERKKQQTREALLATAQRLFIERGFDAVTVAEVAREANVSPATVFNYFPTKEDLFYGQMVDFEATLLDAIRHRAAGESLLAAFRRVVLDGTARLASEEVAGMIQTAAQVVARSAALQAREREIVARHTQALAAMIADEGGDARDEVEALVAATALMGAQRALVTHVHRSVLAGRRGPTLADDARARGERAFARLERGLGDYAVKPGEPTAAG